MSNKRMMYVLLALICAAYIITKCVVVMNSTDVRINQKGPETGGVELFNRRKKVVDTIRVPSDTVYIEGY